MRNTCGKVVSKSEFYHILCFLGHIPLVLVTLPLDSAPVLRNLKQIKAYLGPYQTSMIKPFAFAKISIRDI